MALGLYVYMKLRKNRIIITVFSFLYNSIRLPYIEKIVYFYGGIKLTTVGFYNTNNLTDLQLLNLQEEKKI